MIRTTTLFTAAALGLLLGTSACENDQLNRPFGTVPIDPLFARYVAMGNSITAGFQSGGINDSTQRQSYAVLLAQAMRSPFFIPSMTEPGCPPPYTNVFTQTRLTPAGFPVSTDSSCYLRSIPRIPPPYVSNTAVPGAEAIDIYNNLDAESNANALTTFFLGGLTQAQMLQRADPTFVTVWIGNNDVLGAATNAANAGDSTLITPTATFQARYTAMLDSLEDVGPQGGVLVGVANVTTIPFFSRGSTYYALFLAGAFAPAPFTVTANCAPARGDSVLVPFPFGAGLINTASGGTPTVLDCSELQTVQPAELVRLVSAVTAYNAHISTEATARGWAYLNPNPTLDSLRAIPTQVAGFPALGAPCSANPFGLAFSCDAVHPSAATHRLIARKLAETINAAYGTNVPTTF